MIAAEAGGTMIEFRKFIYYFAGNFNINYITEGRQQDFFFIDELLQNSYFVYKNVFTI
jgi:hypothetical protein